MATELSPLVCKSCNGTGKWDVGTEDEGPCGADYCHDGVLVCLSCSDNSGSDEPAVGEVFNYDADLTVPLCRTHLKQAHDAQAREDRGDYERDMRKDEGR